MHIGQSLRELLVEPVVPPVPDDVTASGADVTASGSACAPPVSGTPALPPRRDRGGRARRRA